MNDHQIKLNNISSYYNDKNKTVLNNFDFEIKKKDFTAIIGENGAGKSSIIKTIFGVCKLKSGSINFNLDINKNYPKVTNYISAVPQKTNFIYNFYVKDFIDFGISSLDKNFLSITLDYFTEYKNEIFEILNINDFIKLNKRINDISSGEFQRVLIAQALLKNPQVLFLDECLSNIDIKFQIEILKLLKKFNDKGMSIIMILHNINLAYNFFDKVVFVRNGQNSEIFEKRKSIETIEIYKSEQRRFIDLVKINFNVDSCDIDNYIF